MIFDAFKEFILDYGLFLMLKSTLFFILSPILLRILLLKKLVDRFRGLGYYLKIC